MNGSVKVTVNGQPHTYALFATRTGVGSFLVSVSMDGGPAHQLYAGSGPAAPGQKVVAWTRAWEREQFALLALQHTGEAHGFLRRRHRDNLRLRKTTRRYALASRPAAVSGLGACLVVASYKENPRVQLLPGQSADWYAYHQAPPPPRKEKRWAPRRWHGKVLACTDTTASVCPTGRSDQA